MPPGSRFVLLTVAALGMGVLLWGPLVLLAPQLLVVVVGQQAACLVVALRASERNPSPTPSLISALLGTLGEGLKTFWLPLSSQGRGLGGGVLAGLVGVVLAVVAGIAYDEGVRQFLHPGAPTIGPWGVARSAPGWVAGLIVVAGVGLTPLADEWFYRGSLFRVAADAGAPRLGALGSSVLFALSRLDVVNFPAYVGLGLLLCAVYHRAGSLAGSWLTHVLLNAAMFCLLFGGYS